MTDNTPYHMTITTDIPNLDVVVQPADGHELARLKQLSGIEVSDHAVQTMYKCCACHGIGCDATGSDCTHCSGSGMCPHDAADQAVANTGDAAACSNCDGTGYDHLNEEICNECYGTGMMESNDLNEMYDYGHTVEHSLARLKKYEDASSYTPLNPKQKFGHAGVDNTMEDDAAEENLLEYLTGEYAKFLLEDIDISSGTQSPLTATVRDEFDKDPLAEEDPVTNGSRSPLSRIKRQSLKK
jgi:hypothetical protein